ncbi:cellulase family glycosylhydrolase [Luedemannella helvata]|uniref:mannan endo-1,4-beta-mannosidase n=1 Tax=Luedemannella helvata TaxID=349315 RepID=A0ABP4VZJ1_9ACTN
MIRKVTVVAGAVAAVIAAGGVALATTASAQTAAFPAAKPSEFVSRKGHNLYLDNKPFRFAGSNNYYLNYSSQFMVDKVLDSAAAAKFQVLRVWGWFDIGTPGGTDSVHSGDKSFYLQYWDAAAGRPALNTGDSGLVKLDYALYKARLNGLKIVLPFTNNWSDFGGMDQYVRWAGASYHDDFYTNATIKGWYKDYISGILNRVNTYTGIRYKDDPTVMTWELANEPRCGGHNVYPRSATCTTNTITTWADEMTRYIKSLDARHLVSVGDEGFYCEPGSADWIRNCNDGVDTIALTKLPAVDVMSFHLYPDGWQQTRAWGTKYITDHVRDARRLGKAVMMGEYGWKDKATRAPVYKEWMDAFARNGGSGALYWMLADQRDGGSLYPDYDGFTVYCPSPGCLLQTNLARAMGANQIWPQFPPVADDDATIVESGRAATLNVIANDIAYQAKIRPNSVDLDPATAGRQATRAVTGGTYAADPTGKVAFTPAEGFAGKASVTYTATATNGAVSNPATITVEVKPDPDAAWVIYSFEDGTDGFAPASWTPDAATVTRQSDFATNGAHGARVVANAADGGAWVGVTPAPALDLSGRTKISYDLRTGDVGTSTEIVLQLGNSWTWCQQNSWAWVDANTTTTVSADLATFTGCDVNINDVRAIYLWFGNGTFDIDAVRVE